MNRVGSFVLNRAHRTGWIPTLIDDGHVRTIKEQILGIFNVNDVFNNKITIGVYAAYTYGQPAIEYDVALVSYYEEIPSGFSLNDYIGEIEQSGESIPYFLFMKRRTKHD